MRADTAEESEGDMRVANIVRPFAGARESPRLAWKPWMRGAVFGAVVGFALGAAVALAWARVEFARTVAEPLAPRNEKVRDHGVPR